MILSIIIFCLLGALAYQDAKKYEVEDIVVMLLWLVTLFYGNVFLLVLSFILLWGTNTIIQKNRFGWGDILTLPCVFALIPYNFASLVALLSVVMFLIVHAIFKKNSKVPVMVFLFCFYCLYLIIQLLFLF